MSASREKKQRQASGPSQKDTQTQQQAQAYRRKATRYTIIGVVVAVLVAALLIYNSGVFQRGKTAAVVGDTNYTVNDVSYYYYMMRNQSFYMYYALGYTPPSDDTVMDAETGKTYKEYFQESALTALTRTTALYDAAIKDGYSEAGVADTVAEQIKTIKETASSNGYSSFGAFLKAQYGRYMTASAYKKIITKVAVAEAYSSDYSDALTYDEAALNAYYDEHKDSLDTFEYSYLYFKPETVSSTDENGKEYTDDEKAKLSEEALAAAKANAEAAVEAIRNGAKIADLIEEYDITTSADHTTSVGSSISSTYSEKLFALSEGGADLVENGDSGYYVVALHSRTLVQDPTADVRHILIKAATETDAEDSSKVVAPTDEAWAAAKAKAEEILAEYEAGEHTAEAFAALAEKYSEDTGSNTNGGLYTDVYNGRFVNEFNSWIFDREHQSGDVDIICHDDGEDATSSSYYGYHVVYFQDWADPVWMNTADSALRSDDTQTWVAGLQEGYSASYTDAVRYAI